MSNTVCGGVSPKCTPNWRYVSSVESFGCPAHDRLVVPFNDWHCKAMNLSLKENIVYQSNCAFVRHPVLSQRNTFKLSISNSCLIKHFV